MCSQQRRQAARAPFGEGFVRWAPAGMVQPPSLSLQAISRPFRPHQRPHVRPSRPVDRRGSGLRKLGLKLAKGRVSGQAFSVPSYLMRLYHILRQGTLNPSRYLDLCKRAGDLRPAKSSGVGAPEVISDGRRGRAAVVVVAAGARVVVAVAVAVAAGAGARATAATVRARLVTHRAAAEVTTLRPSSCLTHR